MCDRDNGVGNRADLCVHSKKLSNEKKLPLQALG